MGKREVLIGKIMEQYDAGIIEPVYPVVGLEEFFDGNEDKYSIAPNEVGYGHPGLAEFHKVLSEIRRRPDVQDVLVAIHECPEADEPADADIWPSAESVYVLTSATVDDLRAWTAPLKPTNVGEGWSGGERPPAAPKPKRGNKALFLIWD